LKKIQNHLVNGKATFKDVNKVVEEYRKVDVMRMFFLFNKKEKYFDSILTIMKNCICKLGEKIVHSSKKNNLRKKIFKEFLVKNLINLYDKMLKINKDQLKSEKKNRNSIKEAFGFIINSIYE